VRGRRWGEAGPADRLLSASRCGGESLPRRQRRVPPCAPVDLNRRRQQCGLGGRSHSRAGARVEGGQRQSRVGRGPAPAAGRPSPGGASRPRELLARVNTASARPRRRQPPSPPLPRSSGVGAALASGGASSSRRGGRFQAFSPRSSPPIGGGSQLPRPMREGMRIGRWKPL
jgi:hypothetical protein